MSDLVDAVAISFGLVAVFLAWVRLRVWVAGL